MKTFEDIEWKKHQLGPGFIQGLLMLDSGIELSIVAGSGMYSNSKAGVSKPVDIMKIDEIVSFEVCIFNDDGFLEAMDDEVLGWQSREDINELIKKHSNA
mgnify:FL=1